MITITLQEWIAVLIDIILLIILLSTITSIFVVIYKAIQKWLVDREDERRREEIRKRRGE